MDFQLFSQLVLYGLVLGSVYALVAVGLSISFGVLDVLNGGHGVFFMAGGYVTFYLMTLLGMPYLLTLPLAGVTAAILGIVCERIAVARLRTRPGAVLIATFCFAVLAESILSASVGNSAREVQTSLNTQFVTMNGVLLSYQRLLIVGVTLILFAAVHVLIKHSTIGLAMRVVARDISTASLMGINVRRVYIATFAISAFLAGVGGALVVPIFAAEPTTWVFGLLKAFVVVILGGMGSIVGALVGGLFLGVTESFGAAYFSGFKEGVGLGLLILILLFRPQGLFGHAK